MSVKMTSKGKFDNLVNWLRKATDDHYRIMDKYAKIGLEELKKNTPKDSGETSESWSYKIVKTRKGIETQYFNSHEVNGVVIAIILQYGHATKNGGFVYGTDYINPSLTPVFKKLANEMWKEVSKR